MTTFIKTRPRLAGVLSILALSGTAVYLTQKTLNKTCPRVPINQVSSLSACRNFVESGEPAAQKPWGTEKSVLLSTWLGGEGKSVWMPSFVALQVDIPIALIGNYAIGKKGTRMKEEENETGGGGYHLVQNLVTAFLDARAKGLEAWFLDRNVPPMSFNPGSRLFGRGKEFGAFMLDSWDSGPELHSQLDTTRGLPADAPHPASAFPSNEYTIADNLSGSETAGTAIYWNFPACLVSAVNKASSYGLPWRLMDGGFQEFIVERVSDEMARVTYVTLECSDLHPGGLESRDYKKVPWVMYELHVFYAQVLLWKTVRLLKRRGE
ncbi:uncharacterized protein BDV17DRAFT_15827 [Aspergillus undulatus]|uniref:uncharacterized protein n=1 Tax=Aspergillus undulatus TaxID=1810928 RepID=UPI003CCD43D3